MIRLCHKLESFVKNSLTTDSATWHKFAILSQLINLRRR
ncbi:unnamed protein product [Arabidopsis lyrata]|nr:unnamed protein product [Arabidopsis lyrata]